MKGTLSVLVLFSHVASVWASMPQPQLCTVSLQSSAGEIKVLKEGPALKEPKKDKILMPESDSRTEENVSFSI